MVVARSKRFQPGQRFFVCKWLWHRRWIGSASRCAARCLWLHWPRRIFTKRRPSVALVWRHRTALETLDDGCCKSLGTHAQGHHTSGRGGCRICMRSRHIVLRTFSWLAADSFDGDLSNQNKLECVGVQPQDQESRIPFLNSFDEQGLSNLYLVLLWEHVILIVFVVVAHFPSLILLINGNADFLVKSELLVGVLRTASDLTFSSSEPFQYVTVAQTSPPAEPVSLISHMMASIFQPCHSHPSL